MLIPHQRLRAGIQELAECTGPQIWAKTFWRTLTVLDSCQVFFLFCFELRCTRPSRRQGCYREREEEKLRALLSLRTSQTPSTNVFLLDRDLLNSLKHVMFIPQCVCVRVHVRVVVNDLKQHLPQVNLPTCPEYLHTHSLCACIHSASVILLHN